MSKKPSTGVTLDARRAKRFLLLLRVISTHAANERMPTSDEWDRIVRMAADVEREIEVEQWLVATGRRPAKRGRKGVGEAQRNAFAREVAREMRENGVVSFPRACAVVAARAKAAGIEGSDPRTVRECCYRAARLIYPEYRELFGLTAPSR